jgi:hypothetical protein
MVPEKPSRRLPEINRSSVDLPHPLGPSKQVHCPPGISKSREENSFAPRNAKETLSRLILGASANGEKYTILKILSLFSHLPEKNGEPSC